MSVSRACRPLASWLCLLVAACATPPPASLPPATPPPNVVDLPNPPAHMSHGEGPAPYAAPARPEAALQFATVPGWHAIDPRPGLAALKRSCAVLLARSDPVALVSETAPWAGRVGEWYAACTGLVTAPDAETARMIVEARFVPVEVVDPAGAPRFTGYFEPVLDARRRPGGAFTAAIPGPPGDLIVSGDRRLQRLANGRTRPYPARADIRPNPRTILGYAHPADLFFLQIQGSGRLVFADGTTVRAAYHAHNGRPFRSTANWLLERGEIGAGEASMQGIRAWMDRAPASRVRQAINANPRYVFFEPQPITRPSDGPAGAQGVPLTALGSFAVDPAFHALGVPYVVETDAPGLGGTWRGVLVAQDTGGAIKGPVRGDLYFGTGSDAGQRAGTMNAPGRLWALLPPAIAERLKPGAGQPAPFAP